MNKIFNKFKDLKVLVLGDIILDKYFFTEVKRISPEAPVPVARFQNEKQILGGAGNVALNLKKLGVQTSIIGFIGDDEDGKKICNEFKDKQINFLAAIESSNTITKTRIVSSGKQLLRLDFEEEAIFSEQKDNKIIQQIKQIINDINIIIVSDYAKGCISKNIIDYIKTTNKYLIADTKAKDIHMFSNFDIITPNFNETLEIAKQLNFFQNGKSKKNIQDFQNSNTNSNIETLGKYIQTKLNSNLLITRSEKGVSFIGEKITHANINNSEVYDVTGAGDTCVSVFSLLGYLQIDTKNALEIMNAAAKITVSKVGNYAPTIDEIRKELLKEENDFVLSKEQLKKRVQILKEQGKKVVFTNGCFDILHKGHISFLTDAKKEGDILIVGVNSDSSVRKLKGNNRPIIDEDSRAFVLSNLKCVDYVIIFKEDTPCQIISYLRPHVHVKGGDYKKEDLPETKIVEAYDGEVKILKFKDNSSTSNIVNQILNGK